MKEFLATLAIIAIIAGIGFYAAGWLTFDQSDDRTTIELKTNEIKQAADETAETVSKETRQLVDTVKKEVRQEVHEQTADDPADEVEDDGEVVVKETVKEREETRYVTEPDRE
jgi:hypothetical protein